jgi:hypothetical protein
VPRRGVSLDWIRRLRTQGSVSGQSNPINHSFTNTLDRKVASASVWTVMYMGIWALETLTGIERTSSVTNARWSGASRFTQLSGPRRGPTVQRSWKNLYKNSQRTVSPSQPMGAEGLRPLERRQSAFDVARIDGTKITQG